MESIQDLSQRIKVSAMDGVREWGIAILMLLISVSSFGLGRLSGLVDSQGTITITQAATVAQALTHGGMYEASRTGAEYFFPWCKNAEKLQITDQVWFATELAAQKAGYSPAKNCRGL